MPTRNDAELPRPGAGRPLAGDPEVPLGDDSRDRVAHLTVGQSVMVVGLGELVGWGGWPVGSARPSRGWGGARVQAQRAHAGACRQLRLVGAVGGGRYCRAGVRARVARLAALAGAEVVVRVDGPGHDRARPRDLVHRLHLRGIGERCVSRSASIRAGAPARADSFNRERSERSDS
jgi:hypothetical protein